MKFSSSTSTFFVWLLMPASLSGASVSDDGQPILSLSQDSSFHFDILGTLGLGIYGGSDISPLLLAAKNITPEDFDSYSEVFYTLANQTKAYAMDPDIAYDSLNVRDTWFSVSTYFRRADFYLHGNWSNPLLTTLWDEQTAAFNNGLAGMTTPGRRIQVPADNFTVEAIWYTPSESSDKKRPTLIVGTGYDAGQEDLYHALAVPALDRGWNCLTYEGPGQPTVRRTQNLGFIPDWERVVTPLVDYLLEEQADVVDSDRLALFGWSMGGYLAARAVAFEPRIKAALLDGGIWDVYEAYSAMLPSELGVLLDAGEQDPFDSGVTALVNSPNVSTTVRWGVQYGLWAFNTHSPFEFFQQLRDYKLENIVDRIQIPVWIADAEYEPFYQGQAQLIKNALGDKATLHSFTAEAGYHVQAGAMQELTRVIFAWLNKTLD